VGWPARQQIGQLFLKFSHAFTRCFAGRRFFPGGDSLYPVLKDTSRQEDAMLALQAFYPDIGTESHHLPLVAAAGVFFLQTDSIADSYVHGFESILEV
jgi:hypothetical protein